MFERHEGIKVKRVREVPLGTDVATTDRIRILIVPSAGQGAYDVVTVRPNPDRIRVLVKSSR